MSEIELPPDPHLLESMRAVGYSFETAVADVIDNSIAAEATTIHFLSSADGDARVSIFDDGEGMSRETAILAMKLAAQSPTATRRPSDLGRFGLGLKTASLSQCRRLTVATKHAGQLTVLCWDLDHVVTTGKWMVLDLAQEEAHALLGWHLLEEVDHGTLVCWTNLDILKMTEGAEQNDLDSAVVRVRDHCALVFHRFVTGNDARKIRMTVNGNAFPALDPFLTKNKATDVRTENLKLSGVTLPVVAYTLPFISKLTNADRQLALAPGSFRDSQGFYIYRAGRLVVWGTWFRLNPKSEMGKLARVRVDVPNSLDHLWVLDIKKSSANPPRDLRQALKNLALQFIKPSTQVQQFRGRRTTDLDEVTRLWSVIVDRSSFRYEVNREHPYLKALAEGLGPAQLERLNGLLEALEQSFPVLDAHNRLSQDGNVQIPETQLDTAVVRAMGLRPMFVDSHPEIDNYVQMIQTVEPYSSLDGFAAALTAALKSE